MDQPQYVGLDVSTAVCVIDDTGAVAWRGKCPSTIVEPMLIVWQALREQITTFDQQLLARARANAATRRLMTIPGVGVVVSLAYTAVIDDPRDSDARPRSVPISA